MAEDEAAVVPMIWCFFAPSLGEQKESLGIAPQKALSFFSAIDNLGSRRGKRSHLFPSKWPKERGRQKKKRKKRGHENWERRSKKRHHHAMEERESERNSFIGKVGEAVRDKIDDIEVEMCTE